MLTERSVIAGTQHLPQAGEHIVGAAQPNQTLTVTVLLRRPPGSGAPSADDLLSGRAKPMDRAAGETALRASPEDMKAVEAFLESEGLRLLECNPNARQIRAQGTALQMNSAFGVQLQNAALETGQPYLTYAGAITIPSALAGIVTAVLGLDNRPIARRH